MPKIIEQKKTLIVVGIALLAIITTVTVLLFTAKSYTDPIEGAIAITYYGDEEAWDEVVPKEYISWYLKEYNYDIRDSLDDWKDSKWVKYAGIDYKVTYEVSNKQSVNKAELKNIAQQLHEEYNFIDTSKVKKAYKFDVEYFIKGSTGEESSKWEDMYSIKIGTNWYLFNSYPESEDIHFCYDAW